MNGDLLRRLAYILSIVTVLVGIGVTYGLAKSEIAQLKDEVNELKQGLYTMSSNIVELKTDVQWIKSDLQSKKKGS